MKTRPSLWFVIATALGFWACGGIGSERSLPDADGNAGSAQTGGGGSGGSSSTITISFGDGGIASIGGSAGSGESGPVPPMVPPMGIDGTGVFIPDGTSSPGLDGAGSGTTGTTGTTGTPGTTVTTGVDAQPADALPTIPAGQMTAGTWDDNLNFSFYSNYLTTTASNQLSGMPAIERADRMVILVKSADAQPVAGAQVSVADSEGHVWSSITGAEGRVIFFPAWASVAPGATVGITAAVGSLTSTTTTTAVAGTVEVSFAQTALPTVASLDLAFVIDTTGSMGDELAYVKAELDNIVGGIATQFPAIAQRWALIAYRDEGDDYVVRSFDFTSALATFRSNLAAQASLGGGDMPEAVDQALAATGKLGWRDGATARVAFWIADAPHHVGKEANVVTALAAATAKGIHVYPVAASGIDDLAEFTMRTAAEVTGGRYLFLTNDSGIGNSHAEPHIPCYYVTTLAAAMRRMVATEVMGLYLPPDPADILRTGGDPQNQQCILASGQPVTAW